MKSNPRRGRISEASLVNRTAGFLREEGGAVCFEVPSLGQSIDIVLERDQKLTAIEAKVFDWRRVISQVSAHFLVADYVAVAVAYREVPLLLLDEASRLGLGIINWQTSSDHIEWVLTPQINEKAWKPQKDIFAMNVRRVSNGS